MKWIRIGLLLWLGLMAAGAQAAVQPVMVVPISGAIGPAGADFVSRGIARAESEQAQLVVLEMDTPGGLDTSMRQIIKAILSSSVPVAVYVAPSGARAASAGTYILYASHIAAMAPGTNLGAATPVQVGMGQSDAPQPLRQAPKDKAGNPEDASPASTRSDMSNKQINDAAAYIRGLAHMRGRNADWGEQAVREAVSLAADEAKEQDVIDIVARDMRDLLKQVDGRRIALPGGGEQVLNTADAPLIMVEVDWKTHLLATITDPSVALILMMIGIYGLFFEFYNPGMVLPGVVGTICLILALFAFHLLPINYAGLALMALGIAFMVSEAFLPSFGVLGMGGAVAFGFGAVMLMDAELPGYGIPLPLIAALAVTSALFMFFIAGMAVRARKQPVISGNEQLMAMHGIVMEAFEREGWVQVHGEQWRAQSSVPVAKGQHVSVRGREGLMLSVAPLDEVNEVGKGE